MAGRAEIEGRAAGPDVVGWREWVSFPDLALAHVKAKIDTGARTSALHAYDVEFFERDGRKMVRFRVHPKQKDSRSHVTAEAEMTDMRYVRDSGGKETLRPVIRATARLGEADWPIEITLTNRDSMGFRLLLGREAVRGRFLVDPGRSFLKSSRKKTMPKTKTTRTTTKTSKTRARGQTRAPKAPQPSGPAGEGQEE